MSEKTAISELADPAETKRAVLQARARELAREIVRDGDGVERLEVIQFALAHENYAVEAHHVREVQALRELTPLPCTPPFVLGVMNVRGQILSVLDIKRFFELPQKGLSDLNKVIIVRTSETDVGFLVDSIDGVRSIHLDEIQASLPTLTGIRAEYLRGVTRERLIILDMRKLLADPKLVVNEEVGV